MKRDDALFANCISRIAAIALVVCLGSRAVAQDFKFLEVTVVDEHGKPLVDVPVEIKMDRMKFPMATDELGMVSLNVSSGGDAVELNVRHEGYESKRIRWRRGRDVPEQHTIKMKPGAPNQGWVVDASGEPVADAEIFAAPPQQPITLLNGRNPPGAEQTAAISDKQGKFELPFQPEGATIVCVSDKGWAQFVKPKKQDDDSIDIRLTPWVRVQLSSPQPEQTVGLHIVNALPKDQGQVQWLYSGETDEQGKFACDRVIQGTTMAYREVPLQLLKGQPEVVNRSHGVVVTLESGTVPIPIGNAKQQATGKLVMPVDYPGEAIWKSGYAVLTEDNVVDLTMRTLIFEYGKLLSQSNVYDPRQRVPATMEPNYLVRYLAPVEPDGTFTIAGVPAGNYRLSAVVPAQPKLDRYTIDVLAIEDLAFAIPKLADEESFELGTHVLDHTTSFAKPK
ncbi:MAG: hypothetical protein ACR2NM_01940 [Bythopirellula sp.]